MSRVGWVSCLVASMIAMGSGGCSLLLDFEECADSTECGATLGAGAVCQEGICQFPEELQKPRQEVSGVIAMDTRWTADKIWVLKDIVTVSPSTVLTIEPGTTILGDRSSALVVRSGGRLEAKGSRQAPIVFTSSKAVGQRQSGDWGGVALLGRASVNRDNAFLNILPDVAESQFGGSDDSWSCGTMEYVRIEFAGGQVEGEEALNGLTFAGCGSGTKANYIQVHFGNDDGLEIFGGTVNINYVLATRNQDDGLDIDLGWRGRGQFIAVQMDASGDNAVEIDNLQEAPTATPQTNFQIYNYTLVGDRELGNSRGITFKAGGAGTLSHGIVLGHRKEAIDVFGAEAGAQAMAELLQVNDTLFYDIGPQVPIGSPQRYFPVAGEEGEIDPKTMMGDDDGGLDEAAYFGAAKFSNMFDVDPGLPAPHDLFMPNFTPSVEVAAGRSAPPAGFDPTGVYLGAFSPSAVPWTDGWIALPGF